MFRFTIRDVLWLMVVVGLGVGWWLDHRGLGRELEQAEADMWTNHYHIWHVGRLWAAEVQHDVQFTTPDGSPVRARPDGGVYSGRKPVGPVYDP